MERLDKVLSSLGNWSRREVKELVRQGRVSVNGVCAASADMKIDPATAQLVVDGQPVSYEQFTYLMLHKPAGVLSAVEDRRQKTVLDLLPEPLRRRGLSPVGRLDKDTEGLLILTNDGELTHKLISPKYHVDKVYYARVDGQLTEEDCKAFEAGMSLDDGLVCQPAGLEILTAGEVSEAHVTLREGKFHQVKRMLAYRGKPVLYLERVRMGPLTLDSSLSRGEFRFLTVEEVEQLRNA